MASLKIVFDRVVHGSRPYGREEGQRFLVAVSDLNMQAPWHEVPLESFRVVVPEIEMSLDGMADFVRRRLSVLEEDGCVMFRYEARPELAGYCKFGLAFAPGRVQMGFEGDEDKAVGGTIDELVELIRASVVVSDVMEE